MAISNPTTLTSTQKQQHEQQQPQQPPTKLILPPYLLAAIITTSQAFIMSQLSSILVASLPPPFPLIISTVISILIGITTLAISMEGRSRYGPIANGVVVVGLQFIIVSVLPKIFLRTVTSAPVTFWGGAVLVIVGITITICFGGEDVVVVDGNVDSGKVVRRRKMT